MRNVPRAPDIDATSKLKNISFRLCRSRKLVEREVELQDVDTRVTHEAPGPTDRVLTDELVHLVKADRASLRDPLCLEIRVGHGDVGVEATRARRHCIRRHR